MPGSKICFTCVRVSLSNNYSSDSVSSVSIRYSSLPLRIFKHVVISPIRQLYLKIKKLHRKNVVSDITGLALYQLFASFNFLCTTLLQACTYYLICNLRNVYYKRHQALYKLRSVYFLHLCHVKLGAHSYLGTIGTLKNCNTFNFMIYK